MNSHRMIFTLLLGCIVGLGGCSSDPDGPGGMGGSGGTGGMAGSVGSAGTSGMPVTDPTGALYKLDFTRATVLALTNIDGTCFTCSRRIEMEMQISVRSSKGAVPIYTYLYNNGAPGSANGVSFGVGESLYITGATTEDLPIHYDGEDRIEIFGDVYDVDSDSGASDRDRLPIIQKNFHYPEEPMPPSPTQLFVDARDTTGNRVRIFYTVTKVSDLED